MKQTVRISTLKYRVSDDVSFTGRGGGGGGGGRGGGPKLL